MASDARAFLAAVRFQLELMRGNPDYWLVLVTTPFFLVIFLGIVRHAGRADLTAVAVPAPVLIALWSMALFVAGEVVDSDRWYGTLEAVVAAPVGLTVLVLGRVAAVTAVSLLSVVEVFLSWSAGLLRDSLRPGPVQQVPLRLGAIVALGVAGFLLGRYLIERLLRRVRGLGSLGHA